MSAARQWVTTRRLAHGLRRFRRRLSRIRSRQLNNPPHSHDTVEAEMVFRLQRPMWQQRSVLQRGEPGSQLGPDVPVQKHAMRAVVPVNRHSLPCDDEIVILAARAARAFRSISPTRVSWSGSRKTRQALLLYTVRWLRA